YHETTPNAHRFFHVFSPLTVLSFLFFSNDTSTTEIYTVSLHDALPISPTSQPAHSTPNQASRCSRSCARWSRAAARPWWISNTTLASRRACTGVSSSWTGRSRPTPARTGRLPWNRPKPSIAFSRHNAQIRDIDDAQRVSERC